MNPERVFRILWGPSLENALDFAFPVVGEAPTFSRRPRAGSTLVSTGASAVAIITGRHFRLKVNAKYFGGQQNFGATGLQAFIDWAADSNAFTLMPNIALPTLTVTGCYLEGPFTQLNPSQEQDSTQTLPLTILHPTVDLGVAWRGLFFDYVAGQSLTDPSRLTYSRSSVGYEITPLGYLLTHPTDSVCDGHYPGGIVGAGLQTTLIEQAVNNDVTNPEDLSNASWDKTTNVTVTANNAKAPDQAITADLVIATVTNATHTIKSNSYTIVAGDVLTGIAFVRDGGLNQGRVRFVNGADNFNINFNLTTGVFTGTAEGAATVTAVRGVPLAGGWTMLWLRGIVNGTSTTVLFEMVLRNSGGAETFAGDAASGLYLWGVTAVHGADNMVASYTPTTSSADTLLLKPFAPTPQAMWVYAKWVDQGGVYRPDGRLFNIGVDAFTAPYFGVQLATTFGFRVISDMTGSNLVTSTFAVGSFGDTHELLALLYPDASVQSVRSINGAAEVNGTRSAAGAAFAAAWSLAQFRFCGGNGSTGITTNGIAVMRAGPLVVAPSPWAVQTIATARYT